MKTFTSKILFFIACFVVFTSISDAQLTEPVNTSVVSMFPSGSITLDGTADEVFWSEQIPIEVLFNSPGDFGGDADLSGTFRFCYNESAFYFFADVTDDIAHNYNGTDGYSWEFDNVELFFNIDTSNVYNSGSYSPDGIQLRFNRGLDGADGFPGFGSGEPVKDTGYDNPMLQYTQVDGASGWKVEAEIPWKYILPSGAVREDLVDYLNNSIGFDVSFADSDGSGTTGARDAQLAWDSDGGTGDEDNAWQDVRKFGLLLLATDTVNKVFADAGPDQSVDEGDVVTLDGSGSFDYQGDSLSFIWKTAPGITLSNPNAVSPTFTAPLISSDTSYTFILNVSDGTNLSDPDSVIVNVKNINQRPIAIAGSDTTINELDTLMLDGSASYDPEGSLLNYFWMPPNDIVLDDPTSATPKFIASELETDQTYNFRLMVSDGYLNSSTDTVKVTVKQVNKIPVADAGPNHVIAPNGAAILDGSSSYDDDGQSLTYSWTALDGGDLSSTDSWMTVFTAPNIEEDKTYRFTLVVNDGEIDSQADTAIVIVDYEPSGIEELTSGNSVKISPNPARNNININLSQLENNSAYYNISILNLDGKVLKYHRTDKSICRFDIDDNLSSGMYIIKITDNNNALVSINKIVVSKE